jgi:hypothetical protein
MIGRSGRPSAPLVGALFSKTPAPVPVFAGQVPRPKSFAHHFGPMLDQFPLEKEHATSRTPR